MPTYKVTGINVGSFNLGESDKLLTIFTPERALIKAVAKGARRPGAKIAGRADLLNVNTLMLSTGRSLDIITQAETIETFPRLRQDLERLAYALYYAELTMVLGAGLSDEAGRYFAVLRQSLANLADAARSPAWSCLVFEMSLVSMLGYMPELTYCVQCRRVLSETWLGTFNHELGGIICRGCRESGRAVAEPAGFAAGVLPRSSVLITPLVWKHLVLASSGSGGSEPAGEKATGPPVEAAHRLMRQYLEHRAGRRMKALDLVERP